MVLNEAQTVKDVLFICHLVKLGSKGRKKKKELSTFKNLT